MKHVVCALLLVLPLLAGCLHGRGDQLPRHVQVFGFQLAERNDVRQLNGETGTDEPCLHGYERSFEQQGVTVGYRRDGVVRRILTRNPSTGVFGISPGMSAAQAAERAQQAGCRQSDGNVYRCGDSISIKLLVDENGRLFAIALEMAE